ncbi:MAG: hypothetical protein ACLFUF_00780 [Opitutales bacterium]
MSYRIPFRLFLLIFTACALLPSFSHALRVERDAYENKAVFSIIFPGDQGGALHINRNQLTSISVHEYITSVFRVKELVIDTNGVASIRIYHTRLLTEEEVLEQVEGAVPGGDRVRNMTTGRLDEAKERVKQRAERSGVEADPSDLSGGRVIKEYPATTHARTIEYRMQNIEELHALHQALLKHWLGMENPDQETEESNTGLKLGGTRFRVEE